MQAMMMKTLKIRIEPNAEQRSLIDRTIEVNRFVYNQFITACENQYFSKETVPSEFDLIKLGTKFRHNSEFIASVYSTTLNETAKRARRAFNDGVNNFRKDTGFLNIETGEFFDPIHTPRYKSYGKGISFTYPSSRDYRLTEKRKKGKIRRSLKLGKIPGEIRCYNNSTPIKGTLKTCTISRDDCSGYFLYFASISYEPSDNRTTEPSKGPVGIDLGITHTATLSDGTVFDSPRPYREKEKLLARHQRKLARLDIGTKGYDKQNRKVKHIYEKVKNIRKNTTEEISSVITRNYDPIVMEDLSVRQIRQKSKNRKMTKGYNDVSLGTLMRRIRDKAESAGRQVILVDPKNTSQECSNCGNLVKKSLSVRIHSCPHCGITLDRDINASINILKRGLFPGSAGDPVPVIRENGFPS